MKKVTYNIRLREKNGMWKGGRISNGFGYVSILMPDHPCAKKSGYIAEHRIVMEKYIGRFLEKNEIVHHKNGKRHDNRISNLQLLKKIDHDRLTCLQRIYKNTSGFRGVSWSKEKRKWVAQICNFGKTILLGRFKNKKDAIKSYKIAKIKYHNN